MYTLVAISAFMRTCSGTATYRPFWSVRLRQVAWFKAGYMANAVSYGKVQEESINREETCPSLLPCSPTNINYFFHLFQFPPPSVEVWPVGCSDFLPKCNTPATTKQQAAHTWLHARESFIQMKSHCCLQFQLTQELISLITQFIISLMRC